MAKSDLNLNIVADEILQVHKLLHMDGCFYLYQGGVFRPLEEAEIKRIVKRKLGAFHSIRREEEVLNALSIESFKKRHLLPDHEKYVNVLNGMIDSKTQKIFEHSPSFCSTFQLPVNYIKGKKCPLFMKAVFEWLETEGKVRLLQEFLGYCLLPLTNYEKILFLLGDGANGKTTLSRVIKGVFGFENCSFLALEQMKERFYLVHLRGKAINFTPEVASGGALYDALVKAIVSGEEVLMEEKHENPFFLKPTAKLIVACNDMPYSKDRSHATDRRLLILNFDRSFSDKTCDKGLAEKLIAEKDGIFCWCLQGLRQLHKRDHFEEPEESESARKNYQKENNPVFAFVEDHCYRDPQSSISKYKFYESYRSYCTTIGQHALSMNRFARELKRHYFLKDDLGMENGHRSRVWLGIKPMAEVTPFFELCDRPEKPKKPTEGTSMGEFIDEQVEDALKETKIQ